MARANQRKVKYLPCRCSLFKKTVWAILTKQSRHRWKIVNCLDRDTACSERACALTTDGGIWPFGIGCLDHESDKAIAERCADVDRGCLRGDPNNNGRT
jgi:hypothetical protein